MDRAALFEKKDKNHDGKLSFEEFMANQPDPEAAKKRFEQWDTGKKGFLSREEFITWEGSRNEFAKNDHYPRRPTADLTG